MYITTYVDGWLSKYAGAILLFKDCFSEDFSIYSFFQSKDGDLVCCMLQTLLTTTRNLCCITWDLEKAMLLSDWSLDFRTNKAMYTYLLSNRLKTEFFCQSDRIACSSKAWNDISKSWITITADLAAKFDCALCERTLKSSIILFNIFPYFFHSFVFITDHICAFLNLMCEFTSLN